MAFQFFSRSIGPFWVLYIFVSKHADKLPWDTTKSGINEDSEIWQEAKRLMIVVGRSVISFLDSRYTDEGTEIAQKELAEATKDRIDAMKASVAGKKTFDQPKKPPRTEMRIQYDAQIKDVRKISEYLLRPEMSGSDVGRHTLISSCAMKWGRTKMTPQSSAIRVSYDLRPSKQCERKIMLDLFNTARASGFLISDYRYVGMGANRFYDFILIHKYLGIDKMISLEHDEEMFLRAEFNCPYKFIKISNITVYDFLSTDHFEGNSIYWMDYDKDISQEIMRDIASLARNVKSGISSFSPFAEFRQNTSKEKVVQTDFPN